MYVCVQKIDKYISFNSLKFFWICGTRFVDVCYHFEYLKVPPFLSNVRISKVKGACNRHSERAPTVQVCANKYMHN